MSILWSDLLWMLSFASATTEMPPASIILPLISGDALPMPEMRKQAASWRMASEGKASIGSISAGRMAAESTDWGTVSLRKPKRKQRPQVLHRGCSHGADNAHADVEPLDRSLVHLGGARFAEERGLQHAFDERRSIVACGDR